MKHSLLTGTAWGITASIAVTLLLCTSTAQAGGRDDHRGRHGPDLEKRVAHMAVELDLSDEQSEQLLTVLQASLAEREALQEKIDAQFKPELCALHLATREQVRAILTEEQAAELEGRMDRLADGGEPRGWHGRKGGPALDCEPAS